MVVYSDDHQKYMDTIFPPKEIAKPLGEVVADAGLKQVLREIVRYAGVHSLSQPNRRNGVSMLPVDLRSGACS